MQPERELVPRVGSVESHLQPFSATMWLKNVLKMLAVQDASGSYVSYVDPK